MNKLLLISVILFFSYITIQAQNELWGMTNQGGNGAGVIFKTDGNGNNFKVVKAFEIDNPGKSPTGELCQASNGKLYGMTQEGGINNSGVLFEYDPITSIYTKKIDFTGLANGRTPHGSLLRSSNGKLYGMTNAGGKNDYGVLFEYNPSTNKLTKKIDFDGVSNGKNPYGSLMQATNGKLYGMTVNGGTNNNGTLFEYDTITSTLTKKLDFAGSANGRNPYGALIQATNGILYGMTTYGGSNNYGVLFEYNIASSTYTKKLDFAGATNGRNPYGSLVQTSNGKLYGLTCNGGTYSFGVLFEYDPAASTFTKKIDFAGTSNGSNPQASLIEGSNGKLYGITSAGGIYGLYGYGVLFEYDPVTSVCTKKIDFDDISKGSQPVSALFKASNGKLYGMTTTGGVYGFYGYGVLFEFDPSTSVFIKKIDFSITSNGSQPSGTLVQSANGKLYGMTSKCGNKFNGVLFEIDPSNSSFVNKIDFDRNTNGCSPTGSLLKASNGKLYGMNGLGGLYDLGTIFEYDPVTSVFNKLFDFSDTSTGRYPSGSLFQSSNGKLYGMTYSGGVNDFGVLFEYDPATSVFSKKLDFDASIGAHPYGSLIEASNGKLYGLTLFGGNNYYGVLFEYDPATSTYSKKIDFNATSNGKNPYGSLMEATNGKLYGLTCAGGNNDKGVLFEYNPATGAFIKRIDFVGITNGSNPYGSLIQALNGNLYGMTSSGGINDYGVIFEFNPANSLLTKKLDFNGINGICPLGDLINIAGCSLPTIHTQPFNQTKCVGDSVNFIIVDSALCLRSYQWQKNSIDIPSATSAIYKIFNVALKDTGNYTCVVSTSGGNVTSNVAHLEVKPIPVVNLGKDTTISSKQSITLKAGNGFDSYLWSNNAATNQIKIDSATFGLGKKTYWVKVTQKGCVGYDTILVTIAKNTSIDVPEANFAARIYPNPTNSIIYVDLSTVKKELIIELTDMNGRIVKSIKIQPNNYETSYKIDVSEFAEGLYFMHISNSEMSKVVKITKF
jgi:uncharacterized repeat protein (TIGR03803 family)